MCEVDVHKKRPSIIKMSSDSSSDSPRSRRRHVKASPPENAIKPVATRPTAPLQNVKAAPVAKATPPPVQPPTPVATPPVVATPPHSLAASHPIPKKRSVLSSSSSSSDEMPAEPKTVLTNKTPITRGDKVIFTSKTYLIKEDESIIVISPNEKMTVKLNPLHGGKTTLSRKVIIKNMKDISCVIECDKTNTFELTLNKRSIPIEGMKVVTLQSFGKTWLVV
jgi:hypothetical protein